MSTDRPVLTKRNAASDKVAFLEQIVGDPLAWGDNEHDEVFRLSGIDLEELGGWCQSLFVTAVDAKNAG